MTTSPARVLGALALLLLPALVLTSSPVAAQQAGPAPGPAAVEVTVDDNGRTVHLVPGQELVVELNAPEGQQWQGPSTSGPLYLVRYSESAGRTTARLQALHSVPEAVQLQARTDRRCFHDGSPCPTSFGEWSLQVVVDEGPPASGTYDCPARAVASPSPDVTYLTESSGGRVQVEVGRTLFVWLHSCTDHYTVPSSGDGPLWRESAGSAANGYATATFRGLRPGTSVIEAMTDPSCFHTATPCARPAARWSVEVEVVPAAADDGCLVPMQVELERDTVTATGAAGVTVRTAPGVQVDLYAYTRPSTTYRLVRSATSGESGVVGFSVRPPANTRLYAQKRGCDPGPSVVLNVATALSLTATRSGPREYVFAGDSLPARPGGLVVSLYRLGTDGRPVLTAQTRADAADGQWRLVRRFTGSGRFDFVVRTGQDLQNAPGASGVRSLLVF